MPIETPYSMAICGAGRVGQTLGRLLASAGHHITAVLCRTQEAAERAVAFIGTGAPGVYAGAASFARPLAPQSVLLITTPDQAIAHTAEQLAGGQEQWADVTVLHCSGLLSSQALEALRLRGAHVGSMHPLHAFGRPVVHREELAGVHWCVEGGAAAKHVARQFIQALHGQASEIQPAQKVLYHAAAAVAGNLITGLMSISFALLAHCGIAPEQARAMLIRLSEGVLQRIKAEDEIVALAGPISRGDVDTVAQHLEHLHTLPPLYLDVYRALSLELVALARQKGTPAAALEQISQLLQPE